VYPWAFSLLQNATYAFVVLLVMLSMIDLKCYQRSSGFASAAIFI
jgi:hypothetical protein